VLRSIVQVFGAFVTKVKVLFDAPLLVAYCCSHWRSVIWVVLR
jgi:hypothetical protein